MTPRATRTADALQRRISELESFAARSSATLRGCADKLRREGLDTIATAIERHARQLRSMSSAAGEAAKDALASWDPSLEETAPLGLPRPQTEDG